MRNGLLSSALLLVAASAAADEKLDAKFEALDAAFVEFLAEEAADADAGDAKDAEMLTWLRDWWDPAEGRPATGTENDHEKH